MQAEAFRKDNYATDFPYCATRFPYKVWTVLP
jgi:hypothetical protein